VEMGSNRRAPPGALDFYEVLPGVRFTVTKVKAFQNQAGKAAD